MLLKKKMDASGNIKWKLVIGYRKLNEKPILNKYSLPDINEIFEQLGNLKYLLCFDLATGFYQIGMSEEDTEKQAFSTRDGFYDLIIIGCTLKDHNNNLKKLFQRLGQNRLKLQPDKCKYSRPELSYLRHVITKDEIQSNLERTEKIENYPKPRSPKEIKKFPGLQKIYTEFSKNC